MKLYKDTEQFSLSYPRKKASTRFNTSDDTDEYKELVERASGVIQPVTASSNKILGMVDKQVKSTDSDYASTTRIPVICGTPDTLFLMDVDGTFTVASEGGLFDVSDSRTVNVDATSKKVVFCHKFISSTSGRNGKGLGVFSIAKYEPNTII